MAAKNIHVLTVATHVDGYLDSLIYTVPSLKVLGSGAPWKGYTTKIRCVYAQLDEYEDDDIIVFCDAYDVLADRRRDIGSLAEKFKKLDVDVLLSVYDYAHHEYIFTYYIKRAFICLKAYEPERLMSCNPGLYMAYCKPLRALLGDLLALASETQENDDERLLNSILNNYTTKLSDSRMRYEAAGNVSYTVGLDVDEAFFHNHVPIEKISTALSFVRGTYKPPNDTITSRESFFYHFIGNQNLDDLCRAEGIPHVASVKQYTNMMKARHYVKFFKFEIILAFALVILVVYSISKLRSK